MKAISLRKTHLLVLVAAASCIFGCSGSKDDFSGSGELAKAKDGNSSPSMAAPNGAKAHAPLMVPNQKPPTGQ